MYGVTRILSQKIRTRTSADKRGRKTFFTAKDAKGHEAAELYEDTEY